MNSESSKLYNALKNNIHQMIKMYRELLEVVRKEKEILISADLPSLDENNKRKESLLFKLRQLEGERIKLVEDICKSEGLNKEEPRLLDLAIHFRGEEGDKLRNLHSVLVLLLNRIKNFNDQNESLVRAALESVNGAMNSIKQTLSQKPVYGGKKSAEKKQEIGAQIMSKQV
ncbi:MAG: flagellar protein FlgN [Bdellovibrionales bacterium]|nr:flagellar protein FlgN [Bdellovibrionales bacterium]